MPRSGSRHRSPSPYSRRMALSNRPEDPPRSRSPPPQKPVYSPSPPPRRHRSRSRSPRRRHDDRPRKSGGGFRWKEKPRYEDDDDDKDGRRDDRRLERGYREQERERPRPRSPDRRDGGRRERDSEVERKFGKGWDVEDKFGKKKDDDGPDQNGGDKPPNRPRKEKKSAPAPTTGEPMIVVNVNDRLGTKASIPCMASDPIRLSYPALRTSVFNRVTEADFGGLGRVVQSAGCGGHW